MSRAKPLPPPTIGMLEEGDQVEYETKVGKIQGAGRVFLHNGVPQVDDPNRRLPLLAVRVRPLRITREGVVVAEVQGLDSPHRARENNAKLQRLRAEFGT